MPTNKKKKGKGKKKSSGNGAGASCTNTSRTSPNDGGGANSANISPITRNPFTPTPADEAKPVGPPVVSSAEHDPVPAPNGASCWICLEGPDDEDADDTHAEREPLRRNCACRGQSSGYAHLTCLANYAASSSEDIWTGKKKARHDANNLAFGWPWESCSNCKQNFSGQLRIDIAREFARSTAGMMPGFDDGLVGARPRAFRHLVARSWITKSLLGESFRHAVTKLDETRVEFKELLDLFGSCRENGVFDGLSPIMSFFRAQVEQLEAETLCNYGQFLFTDSVMKTNSRQGSAFSSGQTVDICEKGQVEEAIRAQSKALEIFQRIPGGEGGATQIKATLSDMKREFQRIDMDNEESFDEEEALRISEDVIKANKAVTGEDSSQTIRSELLHSQRLIKYNKVFEAADVLKTVVSKALRTLGPDHAQTKCAIDTYHILQKRQGELAQGSEGTKLLSILSYDEKVKQYNVRGDDDCEQKVSPSDLVLKRGTAVRCSGLKGATHLNGKKGIVTKYNVEMGRHVVTFPEENGIDDCLVRPTNLRIVFFDDV